MNKEQFEKFCSAVCLNCGGTCCKYFPMFYKKDGKIVEAESIANYTKIYVPFAEKMPREEVPDCHYFKDGKCSIYEDRPELCKRHICNLLEVLDINFIKL